MITKNFAVAALAVAVAVLGAAGSAEAGKRGGGGGFKFGGGGFKHSFHHHHGFGHKRHFGPKIIIGVGGGCGYYYDKWQFTGSRYWKAKYFNCIS